MSPAEELNKVPPKRPFPIALFLVIIFVPTLATMVAVQAGLENLSLGTAILGGCLSGCIGGPLLASRLGKSGAQRAIASLLLMFVLGAGCVSMNCAGCIASSNFKIFRP